MYRRQQVACRISSAKLSISWERVQCRHQTRRSFEKMVPENLSCHGINDADQFEDELSNAVLRNLSCSSNSKDHSASAASQKAGPLIQVIDATDEWEESNDNQSDLPPLLLNPLSSIGDNKRNNPLGLIVPEASHGSLLDQMIKDANEAQQEKNVCREFEERKIAKKFGTGLQKGFLNSRSSTTPAVKKTNRKSSRGKVDEVARQREKKKDGDVHDIDSESEVPTTIHRPSEQKTNKSVCYLPEVHDAMNMSNGTPFEKLLHENRQQWATPELMQKITENPRLVAGMSNPVYMAALQEFQENPKRAMQKYKQNEQSKDILRFLTEFCGVLGEHFTILGELQKQQERKGTLGPLAQQALKRHASTTSNFLSESSTTRNGGASALQQDEDVQRILSNPELTQLLVDPEMQQVIHESTTTNGREKFRYYMQHPNFAPKLQKLIKAGLLKIEA